MFQVENILINYSLPKQWSNLDHYIQHFDQLGIKAWSVGLTANNLSGLEVSASAVGSDKKLSIERAYFELIERASIIDSIQNKVGHFQVSTQPDEWTFAKSNGVAAHKHFENAKTNAILEVVERDHVLRSWYYQDNPTLIANNGAEILLPLMSYYNIQVAIIHQEKLPILDKEVYTIGVFAFPKSTNSKKFPVLCGFACRASIREATTHAANEAIQRLVFLHDETISNDIIFSPTPMFHLDYASTDEGMDKIWHWINAERANQHSSSINQDLIFCDTSLDQWTIHELVLPLQSGEPYVVQACNTNRMPLTFGRGNPSVVEGFNEKFWIHPIA